MSSELALYMTRVDLVVDAVCGTEYRDLIKQADSDPKGSGSLYRRAFELFNHGCARAQEHPEEYEGLITWKHERTIHGKGRPGLEEALSEEYINTWYGNEPADEKRLKR